MHDTGGEKRDQAGSSGTRRATRCVLLARAPEDAPLRLIESLRNQGLDPVVRSDPHHAMSTLVAPDASGRRPDAVILVLIEPRRLARAAELVSAIERFAGRATCWLYEHRDGAPPEVRRVEDADLETWAKARSAPNAPAQGPAPGPVQAEPSVASRSVKPEDRVGDARRVHGGDGGTGPTGGPPRLRLTETIDPVGNDRPLPNEPEGGRGRPEEDAIAESDDDASLSEAELRMLLSDDASEGGAHR